MNKHTPLQSKNQADSLAAALDAAIGDVQAFESEHGARSLLTEPPIEGEAELYRNLRSLKQRYAQVLDDAVTEHEHDLWEWASPDYRGASVPFCQMSNTRQTELVRQCQYARNAAAAAVRNHPDPYSRAYIEARSRLQQAEGDFRCLYYRHLQFIPDLKREYAKNRDRNDEYAAADLRLIENVTFERKCHEAA
ncbi:MAG: hypothetical protein ACLPTZ_11150 [Beijerinckiaceae bacterium]